MTRHRITQPDVVRRSRDLPGLPAVLKDILNTLDDPDANYNVLIKAILRDPVITARVLWMANTAASRASREEAVTDVATAVSLTGVARVRHVALISSLSTLAAGMRIPAGGRFWVHSISVGLACEELATHLGEPAPAPRALVAGLLHDIGQLWLTHFDRDTHAHCKALSQTQGLDMETLEIEHFGVTHGMVGGWLAQLWHLPSDVVDAIALHHEPSAHPASALVAIVHIGEVLSHALDTSGDPADGVSHLSPQACDSVGMVWDEGVRPLFGRIEARSRHANRFFSQVPGASTAASTPVH